MHPGQANCTLKPLGDKSESGSSHAWQDGAEPQKEPGSLAVVWSCHTCVGHLPRDFLQCETESPGMGAAVGLDSYLQLAAFLANAGSHQGELGWVSSGHPMSLDKAEYRPGTTLASSSLPSAVNLTLAASVPPVLVTLAAELACQ